MKTYPLRNSDEQPETVILANGDFPSHPLPLTLLTKSRYIVCCDGAVNELVQKERIPSAIVGDCDSLSAENRDRFASILHPDKDQETNDLTKSVNFCLKQRRDVITILGATGKREDHALGNISLLADYVEMVQVEMITDYGVFTPITSSATFESFAGQQISLFCMDSCPITTLGLKYPLTNKALNRWWQGSLNETLEDSFTIETKGKVVVFRAYAD